jgi:hypothetical protein
MNVIFDNGLYKIARTTGPTHNFLALALDAAGGRDAVPEALVLNDSERVRVTAELVKNQVIDALAEFNARFDTTYGVTRIQFVPSDTLQPADIYKHLALEVLRHFHDRTVGDRGRNGEGRRVN